MWMIVTSAAAAIEVLQTCDHKPHNVSLCAILKCENHGDNIGSSE